MLSHLSFKETMSTKIACQGFNENDVHQLFVESLFCIGSKKHQILVEDSWPDDRLFCHAWM
jgi:hypothetical protein